jgi:hypothetical protein
MRSACARTKPISGRTALWHYGLWGKRRPRSRITPRRCGSNRKMRQCCAGGPHSCATSVTTMRRLRTTRRRYESIRAMRYRCAGAPWRITTPRITTPPSPITQARFVSTAMTPSRFDIAAKHTIGSTSMVPRSTICQSRFVWPRTSLDRIWYWDKCSTTWTNWTRRSWNTARPSDFARTTPRLIGGWERRC